MEDIKQIEGLLRRYPPISDQVSVGELTILLSELQRVCDKGVEGGIVEFGCYTGTSSLLIGRLLRMRDERRAFHVYDSFQGLPEKTEPDYSGAGEQFKAGELTATKTAFIAQFKKAGLPLPHIHKGWFQDIDENEVPDTIALAFLDGDYYLSIKQSLKLITHKLSKGAVIIVDDYLNEQLPGAQRAVDEWRRVHEARIASFRAQQSLAVIRLH